jgi:Divergent InlB B-repeat domain
MTRCVLIGIASAAVCGWAGSTASARIEHYLITVTASGPGVVTGNGDGGSFDCSNATCSALIKQNTTIELTATPDDGDQFTGWGGACADFGNGSTCELQVSGPKDATAGFGTPPPPSPPKVTLTVVKAGTGSGYVGGAGGIDCGPTCSNAFFPSSPVTLLAIPDDGSTFTGWSGAGCSGTGQCNFTITADSPVTATFTHVDRAPPLVRTLRGSARPGATADLRYRVWDDSGKSREVLTILQGKAQIARVTVPLRTVQYRHVYTAHWRVPARLRPGNRLFCAVASDAAGNTSKRSCATFTVT